VHFSDVEVDLERRVVTRRGEELKLTPAEYNLLTYFLQNPDRPLTRDMILNSVWGYEFFPNTRTVDAHVVKLRQKLEPEPNVPAPFSDGARRGLPVSAVARRCPKECGHGTHECVRHATRAILSIGKQ
jgi:DNA-binding winged helix-turn-helix (wHTH) protein